MQTNISMELEKIMDIGVDAAYEASQLGKAGTISIYAAADGYVHIMAQGKVITRSNGKWEVKDSESV